MSDFVKVYDTLLTSSVWFQGKDVRILWITLLVMADADGNVHSSLPGLAHAAALTRAEAEAALSVLEAPDPDDTSGVLDGVRVVREPWGWHVVNRTAYREKQSPKQAKTAARVRKYREKQKRNTKALQGVTGNAVTLGNAPKRTEAEAEAEIIPPPLRGVPPSGGDPPKPKPKKAKPKTTLCDSRYSPSDAVRRWCTERGISERRMAEAVDEMRDWSRSNSRRKADWDAALRNWLRKDAAAQLEQVARRNGGWVQHSGRPIEETLARTLARQPDEAIPEAEQF